MKLPKVPVIPITSKEYFDQIKQMKIKDQKDREIGRSKSLCYICPTR